MEALGINLGYLLAFALSFGIMFVVLRAWVFKPLLGQLDKRKTAIARGLEDARVAAEARANAEKEASGIIDAAQAHAAEIIRNATERASQLEEEIRVQAEQEAVNIRETTRADLEEERNHILSDLRGQVASLAIAAAQKLIAVNLDEQRQRQLVDEFFSGISNGRVTILDNTMLDGAKSVEITSALPLTEEEKVIVGQNLAQQLGYMGNIDFRVDPTILGGLVIRIGDRVVNGSVSGQLEELRQSLI